MEFMTPAVLSFTTFVFVCGSRYRYDSVLNYAPRHEDVWESGGIAPCVINLGTIGRAVIAQSI
jgi:hypothetical protein